jgi:hypothetical protein
MSNLSAQPLAAPFPTSETFATSEYRGPFGAVYYDGQNPQDAYMLVNCQESFAIGESVVIDESGLASQIGSTSYGQYGIIVATVSGSDTAAWAQIEGQNDSVILTSGCTTATLLFAPATTDAGYLDFVTSAEGNIVRRVRVITAPSTSTTPFTSDTQASALVGVGSVFIGRGGAFVEGIATVDFTS